MQQAIAPVSAWPVFGWYMLGAVLRLVYGWLGWVAQAAEERTCTFKQKAAVGGQQFILTVVVAFLWTGSHVWNLLAWLNVEVPFEVVATPLSSIAAGFVLEWFLIERLAAKFARRPDA